VKLIRNMTRLELFNFAWPLVVVAAGVFDLLVKAYTALLVLLSIEAACVSVATATGSVWRNLWQKRDESR